MLGVSQRNPETHLGMAVMWRRPRERLARLGPSLAGPPGPVFGATPSFLLLRKRALRDADSERRPGAAWSLCWGCCGRGLSTLCRLGPRVGVPGHLSPRLLAAFPWPPLFPCPDKGTEAPRSCYLPGSPSC